MISQYISKINQALSKTLNDTNKRYSLKPISGALFTSLKDFTLRPGKRIRPLLFILSYKGYTKKTNTASDEKKLFIAAGSIELLHDYMLIHDDIIDNSDIRRGKPTVHKLFDKKLKFKKSDDTGKHLAIVAGDILFALAIESILTVNEEKTRKELALKKLTSTAAYTGLGEFIDVLFSRKNIKDVSEKDIFLNYTLKTARYTFECPLTMGAILAGADKHELGLLSKLGLAAGKAFQIYDDFLDLFSTQKVIGKSILTDLSESKKTLLVFKAHQNLKGDKKKNFENLLIKKDKTYEDLLNFRKILIESGSYDYCLKKMTRLQKEALRATQALRIRKPHKEAILSVINKLSPASMPLNLTANRLP